MHERRDIERRRVLVQDHARVERHALHAAQARERPKQIGGLDRRFRMHRLPPPRECAAGFYASMRVLIPESEMMVYAWKYRPITGNPR
jgi:hypothetical protein